MPLTEIVTAVNRFFTDKNIGEKYATVIIARVQHDGNVEYVNCGHILPLVVSNGEIERPSFGNLPVGLLPDAKYKSDHCQLKPGDRLVLVTDGVDNSSIISLEALVKVAQQSGVLIYAVGLLSDEDRRDATRAKRELDSLTEATGGRAFFPKELADVEHIAQEVAHDIRNQYTISYSPSNPALDGTFRAIKIVVNAPGHPTVRTRTGYYATPDQAQHNKAPGASK